MQPTSRRRIIGVTASGLAGLAGVAFGRMLPRAKSAPAVGGPLPSRVQRENENPGTDAWRREDYGFERADDTLMQIKGYASKTSVNLGESIDFHVTTTTKFTIEIYRIGYYGGTGGRLMMTSPQLTGVRQPDPTTDPVTGEISCGWSSAWQVTVPPSWTSGFYLAVLNTSTGWRNFVPFVVRDDQRKAALCVVLPFTTYQAYNIWPADGRRGKSLYYGFDPKSKTASDVYELRARKVSFDRPYAGSGIPQMCDLDMDALRWMERQGYDLTYATSIDLHQGTIDPTHYRGLVFTGHDEYWSSEMRAVATSAVAGRTSLAFLAANNVYWHIRFEPSADGRPARTMVCYKTDPDPQPGPNGETRQWRDRAPGPGNPEQSLIGVLYNGYVATPAPLVVKAAKHWVWAGTGLKDGDKIADVVGGEADGFVPQLPPPVAVQHTMLSASPYQRVGGVVSETRIQNTSVYETKHGSIVFAAGSLFWPRMLGRDGQTDPRIQQATANVLDRIADGA